jgi:hypothetical protein
MAQKYYNTVETAKILGKTPDEVKQMLDRRGLHGYRDGADWKFKVEDIDGLAKDNLAKAAPPAPEEEGGGDVLLSEVELGQADPGLSGTVIGLSSGAKGAANNDIRMAESDIALGALGMLGDSSKTPPAIKKEGSSPKQNKFEKSELALEDSNARVAGSPTTDAGANSSSVDLSGREQDDDVLLSGSSVGGDVSLGGDSGISLVDPADSGFSLETPVNLDAAAGESLVLGEDDLLAPGGAGSSGATLLKTDDDFQLTPLEETADADESESGSQVIALDSEGDESGTMIGAAGGASMAAMLDEDLSAQPALDMGLGSPLTPSSVLGAQPGALADASLSHAAAVAYEAPYTVWQIVALSFCVVFLLVCGIMIFDLIRNMWGWDQPYSIDSKLMDWLRSFAK